MNKNIIIAVIVIIIIAIGVFVFKITYKPLPKIEETPVQAEKVIPTDTTSKIDANLNSIDLNPNIDEDFKNIDSSLNNL